MINNVNDLVQKQASFLEMHQFMDQINLSNPNDLSHSKTFMVDSHSNNRINSFMNQDIMSIFSRFDNSKLIQP